MRMLLRLSLVLLAPVLSGIAAPPAGAASESASFTDDFDDLNMSRWYVSDGWVNGDHQNCTWSQQEVAVREGALRIGFSARPNAKRPWSCGEVQTRARFGYGTYETRLRTPKGSGLNANMFTFIGPQDKQPHDEIDFEFLLKDTSRVQLNTFVAGKGGNERMTPLETSSDGGFADYAFVWEPSRIRWFVNGRQVRELNEPLKVPTHPSKIFLSLWGTDTLNDWLGRFDPPAAPLEMAVDRVSFTALGDACQFPESIACPDNISRSND